MDMCHYVRALQVPLAAEAMGLLAAGMLLALGFRLHREQGFTYWLRAPRARRAAVASLSSAGSSKSAPAPSSVPSAASASPLSASPAGSPLPSRPAAPAPGRRRGPESAAGGLPPTEAVLAGAGLAAAEAAPLVFVHGVGLGLVRRPLLAFWMWSGVPARACERVGKPALLLTFFVSLTCPHLGPVNKVPMIIYLSSKLGVEPYTFAENHPPPGQSTCRARPAMFIVGIAWRGRHPTCTSSRSCCARCRAGRWCCWRCARSP